MIERKNHEECYGWLDESVCVMKVVDGGRKDGGIVFGGDEL
ncbi:hypothetical protein [Bacillus pumilus]|nr:hypothetical protein [Bacillus pumilus]